MKLQEAFKNNWEKIVGVGYSGKVLLAVSGGSDSMVMTDLFIKSGIPVVIGHCNFMLRGGESDADEQVVANFAAHAGVPFFSVRFDTRQEMEAMKKGVQETARILRYEWLERIRKEQGCDLIATAHHMGDNVETVLMHLMKGSGIAGLHGIPERAGVLVRPLLFADKTQITEYVGENGVPFREDASNASDAYTRNKIRHHIVPVMEQWFPEASRRIHETAQRIAEAEIIYRRGLNMIVKKLFSYRGNDIYIPIRKLKKLEPISTICYELFSPFGFKTAQVSDIIQLMDVGTGKYVYSATHRIIKNRDFLVITGISAESADLIVIHELPATIETADSTLTFSLRSRPSELPTNNQIACLDAAALRFPLVLRRWRTGDYFYPLGMGMKKKKLSRFLIDQKVSIQDKERLWVLESDKRIVWVVGRRIDERFKVKSGTDQVLWISIN